MISTSCSSVGRLWPSSLVRSLPNGSPRFIKQKKLGNKFVHSFQIEISSFSPPSPKAKYWLLLLLFFYSVRVWVYSDQQCRKRLERNNRYSERVSVIAVPFCNLSSVCLLVSKICSSMNLEEKEEKKSLRIISALRKFPLSPNRNERTDQSCFDLHSVLLLFFIPIF